MTYRDYDAMDEFLGVLPDEVKEGADDIELDECTRPRNHGEGVRKIAITGSDSELFHAINFVEDAIRGLPFNLEVSGTYPRNRGSRSNKSLELLYDEYYADALALLVLVGAGRPNPEVPDGIVPVECQYMEYFYERALRDKIPVHVFLLPGSQHPERVGETRLVMQLRERLLDKHICYNITSARVLVRQVINTIYSELDRGDYDYDVAISFAGEDRETAEEIAKSLNCLGIRAFYDHDYTHEMLGTDLPDYLGDVYENRARYCIVLSSAHYMKSRYALIELDHAMARQLREQGEYILQFRLDKTPIPILKDTIAYTDFKDVDTVVKIIEAKLYKKYRKTI